MNADDQAVLARMARIRRLEETIGTHGPATAADLARVAGLTGEEMRDGLVALAAAHRLRFAGFDRDGHPLLAGVTP